MFERLPGWPEPGEAGLVWLGQAGFWIETGSHRLLIDPYLSNSLGRKYAGDAHKDHTRQVPIPVAPKDLPRPDLILATHGHTDHLDHETLAPLHAQFPDVPVVVPASCEGLARERIGIDARLILVDAGDRCVPIPGLELHVLPAAHETLERDSQGRHLFLGYGLAASGLRLYHSGDTIPFDGLEDAVRAFAPDIALLPVNGRDAQRLAMGVPGNLTLEEAVSLCLATGITYLVPHHFGMFAFNTEDPARIEEAATAERRLSIHLPHLGEAISLCR